MTEEFVKILTPPFRMSFPSLFEKHQFSKTSKASYQLTAMFPKGVDISILKAEAKRAVTEKWGEKVPKKLKSPFLDGDDQESESFAGTTFVRLNTQFQPGVIDGDKQEVISEKEVKGGYWARATINAYAWEFKNEQGVVIKKGVSFGLQNVQLLPIGAVIKMYEGQKTDYELVEEPFSKGASANPDADFDAVDCPSEDAGNYESGSKVEEAEFDPFAEGEDDIPF